MTALLPLWAWCKRHPVLAFVVLPLLIVAVVLYALWRGAAGATKAALGQRDTARRERDDAQARAESAAAAVRRVEDLRADEERARREHEAAVKALDDRRDAEEARASEARSDLWDARTEDELARIVEERRKSGRLP